jgi:outer membrane lipoprotein carrier protein
MSKNSVLLFVILLFMSLSHYVMAVQSNHTLNQFYQLTRSLQANFEQTVSNTNGRVIEISQGSLILNRPNQFVLAYSQPVEQQYISNGRTIWIYDVELEQVNIKNLDEGMSDTPALLLSSSSHIYQYYDVSDLVNPSSEGLLWVQLLAKKEEMTFQKVLLAFKKNRLKQMVMYDNFGHVTELKFSQIQINKPFANRIFTFTPPEGVDVIGEVRQY